MRKWPVIVVVGAAALARLDAKLDRIINLIAKEAERMSQGLDDLQAAVASLSTSVDAAAAEIHKLADEVAAGANQDPALEEVAARMHTLGDTLDAAVSSAEPPPPAP
jgi:methyl-accepting chemotaxis protein